MNRIEPYRDYQPPRVYGGIEDFREALEASDNLVPLDGRRYREPHGYECECRRCRDCEPEPDLWRLVSLVGAGLVCAGSWLLLLAAGRMVR